MQCCICIQQKKQHLPLAGRRTGVYSIIDLGLDELDYSKFEWKDIIGEGSFGTVHHVIRKEDGKHMACKVINCSGFEEEDFDNLKEELKIVKDLEFHGTPKCYGIHFDDEKECAILMELCTGGHLYERMLKADEKIGERYSAIQNPNLKQLSEYVVTRYVTQILKILRFLHGKGIVHCDLKPTNFVFVDEESDELKILDFGLSQIRGKGKRCFKLQGTPKYIAPEAISNEGYTETFDMWSLGVITFEMLHGYTPFSTRKKLKCVSTVNPHIIMKSILRGFQNKARKSKGPWFNTNIKISPEARDFIFNLLKKKPFERLTACEALHHPWIADNNPENGYLLSHNAMRHLEDFSNHSSIQMVLMPLIVAEAKKLNKFLLDKLDKDFEEIDKDGSGEIDFQEFVALLKKQEVEDIDEEKIKLWFQAIDTDQSGTVCHNEFLEFFAWEHVMNKDIRFWELMESFDSKKTGFITLQDIENKLNESEETRELVGSTAMKGFRKLFEQFEEGKIPTDEFSEIIQHRHGEFDDGSYNINDSVKFSQRRHTRMLMSQEKTEKLQYATSSEEEDASQQQLEPLRTSRTVSIRPKNSSEPRVSIL